MATLTEMASLVLPTMFCGVTRMARPLTTICGVPTSANPSVAVAHQSTVHLCLSPLLFYCSPSVRSVCPATVANASSVEHAKGSRGNGNRQSSEQVSARGSQRFERQNTDLETIRQLGLLDQNRLILHLFS